MSLNIKSDEVIIREYRDSDYEICRELWIELIRYHRDIYNDFTLGGADPGRGFEDYLNSPVRKGTWVAEYEGSVVGMGGLFVNNEIYSEVEPMIVNESHRDKVSVVCS